MVRMYMHDGAPAELVAGSDYKAAVGRAVLAVETILARRAKPTNDARPAPRWQHEQARNLAHALRVKDEAGVWRGELSQEQKGWLAAVYKPASDFRCEVVDGKIVVTPIGAPSADYLHAGAGWSTDKYVWAIEDSGICIRQKPTAAAIANWTSGGTSTLYDKRNAGHEALWQRWTAAQKGRS